MKRRPPPGSVGLSGGVVPLPCLAGFVLPPLNGWILRCVRGDGCSAVAAPAPAADDGGTAVDADAVEEEVDR